MPRVTGWSKLFLDYTDDKHVVSERELLELVVASGRQVNEDWRGVISHAMRVIGWKLRGWDRTYRRRVPKAPRAALASKGGVS